MGGPLFPFDSVDDLVRDASVREENVGESLAFGPRKEFGRNCQSINRAYIDDHVENVSAARILWQHQSVNCTQYY